MTRNERACGQEAGRDNTTVPLQGQGNFSPAGEGQRPCAALGRPNRLKAMHQPGALSAEKNTHFQRRACRLRGSRPCRLGSRLFLLSAGESLRPISRGTAELPPLANGALLLGLPHHHKIVVC